MKQITNLVIQGVANGLVVNVGCQQFVYEEGRLAVFFEDLRSYLADPEKMTEEMGQRTGRNFGRGVDPRPAPADEVAATAPRDEAVRPPGRPLY